jgi:hypothetical protein
MTLTRYWAVPLLVAAAAVCQANSPTPPAAAAEAPAAQNPTEASAAEARERVLKHARSQGYKAENDGHGNVVYCRKEPKDINTHLPSKICKNEADLADEQRRAEQTKQDMNRNPSGR